MRCLITGSEGVIGKELSAKLGHHELCFLDKKTGCDLATTDFVGLRQFDPEVIFHLAASFERTDESPFFLEVNHRDNIVASSRLSCVLPSLKNLHTFVFASSYLIYDPRLYLHSNPGIDTGSLTEHSICRPRNLCGMSKLYIERELDFVKAHLKQDMRLIHARIFRVYGRGSQDFVSRCIDNQNIGLPALLWNKENRFDYIHARDVAEGLQRLAFSDAQGIVNLGTGVSRKIEEVIQLTGVATKPVSLPDQKYENSYADTSLLKHWTDWVPEITLEEGIKDIQ